MANDRKLRANADEVRNFATRLLRDADYTRTSKDSRTELYERQIDGASVLLVYRMPRVGEEIHEVERIRGALTPSKRSYNLYSKGWRDLNNLEAEFNKAEIELARGYRPDNDEEPNNERYENIVTTLERALIVLEMLVTEEALHKTEAEYGTYVNTSVRFRAEDVLKEANDKGVRYPEPPMFPDGSSGEIDNPPETDGYDTPPCDTSSY
jgi:hypothetical protein